MPPRIAWSKVEDVRVGLAPSGRAACRDCGEKIALRALRIEVGSENPFGDGDISYKFLHPDCAHPYFGKLNVSSSKDLKGFKKLSGANQEEIESLFKPKAKSRGAQKKRKKEESSSDDDYSDESSESSDSGAAPAKKKAKKGGKDIFSEPLVEEKKVALTKLSVAQLKNLLRLNNQLIGGNKPDLVDRVAYGQVHGALPKCQKCYGGSLHWDKARVQFFCKGFMDDDTFKYCSKRWEPEEVEHLPWRSE